MSAPPLNFSTTTLPDGVVLGCPWPHTIVTWPSAEGRPKQRGATKVEHDLWRALQQAESERDAALRLLKDLNIAKT